MLLLLLLLLLLPQPAVVVAAAVKLCFIDVGLARKPAIPEIVGEAGLPVSRGLVLKTDGDRDMPPMRDPPRGGRRGESSEPLDMRCRTTGERLPPSPPLKDVGMEQDEDDEAVDVPF